MCVGSSSSSSSCVPPVHLVTLRWDSSELAFISASETPARRRHEQRRCSPGVGILPQECVQRTGSHSGRQCVLSNLWAPSIAQLRHLLQHSSVSPCFAPDHPLWRAQSQYRSESTHLRRFRQVSERAEVVAHSELGRHWPPQHSLHCQSSVRLQCSRQCTCGEMR